MQRRTVLREIRQLGLLCASQSGEAAEKLMTMLKDELNEGPAQPGEPVSRTPTSQKEFEEMVNQHG